MSGGEGQAGWAYELAQQQEMISKQRNVQSQSRLWVCVGGRRTTLDLIILDFLQFENLSLIHI